jgi:hypothetical protein
VVNITPRPLYPQYPLNRRLGDHHCRSTRFGEAIKFFALPGFDPRNVQPVAQSLYRLRYLPSEAQLPSNDDKSKNTQNHHICRS